MHQIKYEMTEYTMTDIAIRTAVIITSAAHAQAIVIKTRTAKSSVTKHIRLMIGSYNMLAMTEP